MAFQDRWSFERPPVLKGHISNEGGLSMTGFIVSIFPALVRNQ
jgi:hypothetical protein